MNTHKIVSELSATALNTGTAYNLAGSMRDNNNRNNIGTVQMVHDSGSGATVKVQGSADEGVNWIDLATAITASTGKTMALLPYLRVVVTTVGTGTVTVYVAQ